MYRTSVAWLAKLTNTNNNNDSSFAAEISVVFFRRPDLVAFSRKRERSMLKLAVFGEGFSRAVREALLKALEKREA